MYMFGVILRYYGTHKRRFLLGHRNKLISPFQEFNVVRNFTVNTLLRRRAKFDKYVSLKKCAILLTSGKLHQGVVRIKSLNNGYVSLNSDGSDVYIDSIQARNRALPGDVVAVQLFPEAKWIKTKKNNKEDVMKRGKIVTILKRKHSGIVTGHLRPYWKNAFGFGLMIPTDRFFPCIKIPLNKCPANFCSRPQDFESVLFVAKIRDWSSNSCYASGELIRCLGQAGDISAETEVILADSKIKDSPFPDNVLNSLPDGDSWYIPKEELSKRKDLRKECIFTIDPPTARDLDDALSCKKIGEDIYEVGVHIADVSYFISEDSPLDDVAKKRATSVYLTQKVIPMLPSVLCEKLCSLNSGVDRLAYSVMWKMKSDGQVLSEWFGRSVIRSCVKLTYNHAQQLIDTPMYGELDSKEFPVIANDFTLKTIQKNVNILFRISKKLRKSRLSAGAINYSQPKLVFTLDQETSMPNGVGVHEYKESNKLIEEFMLLANMAVGRKIHSSHTQRCVLRHHPPPKRGMMNELADLCKLYDIPFDITNSRTINYSLDKLRELSPETRKYIEPAIVLFCTKPSQLAKYFCTGTKKSEKEYFHYGLNVPIYTHFTSPIRRYPDILVHRLLTAALDKTFVVKSDVPQLKAITEHCNEMKLSAKKASDQSLLLFFAFYLQQTGHMDAEGVVINLQEKGAQVLCIKLGIVSRVDWNHDSITNHKYDEDTFTRPKIILDWVEDSNNDFVGACSKYIQELKMFSPVDVVLSVDKRWPTHIQMRLKNPCNLGNCIK